MIKMGKSIRHKWVKNVVNLHSTKTLICLVTAGSTLLYAMHSYIPSQYLDMLWIISISPDVPISVIRIKKIYQINV